MAWNEPGGGNNGGGKDRGERDPWGGGNGRNNPPDLDDLLKNFSDKLGKIFGGGKGGSGGSDGGKGPGASLVMVAVVVAALVWAMLGIYQVDAKEKALVLRFGKFHSIVGDGLHWNPPLIDIVTKVRVTEERQYQTRGQMLTEDENIVELPMTVHYNIKSIKDFLLLVKDPEISLRHATESALRHVVGSTGFDEVVSTGRQQLSVDVSERLQTYLDSYGAGIHVVKVNILEAKPPSAVKAAYDDVIKAREDRERLVNEAEAYANGIIPEAHGRAARVIEEANAYKAQVVAEAQGEAQRFTQVLGEYKKAPEVTRERLYLDAIQDVLESTSKIMVDVEGGNNMLYLPLDKMVQQSSVVGPRGGSLSSRDIDSITQKVIENINIRSQQSSSPRRESR
jgi:membrane protease subunit HflK